MSSLEHTVVVRRIAPAAALAVAVAFVGSCMKNLPTGTEGELTAGINIHEHANFLGDSAHLESDASNLSEYNGPCEHSSYCGYGSCYDYNWDDCISSIKVAPGWRATIYRDSYFDGEALYVTADAPNLQLVRGTCDHGGLNDCISSIRVEHLH